MSSTSESNNAQALLRELPAVSQILQSDEGEALCATFGEGAVKFELRRLLDETRRDILSGSLAQAPDLAGIASALKQRLVRLTHPEGRAALNATGILLHTGLGRAPLADDALKAFSVFGGYSVLQTDLDTGTRSLREERIEALLKELTGCEAATVVNNNAAATMLTLHTLAAGKEVIVSRGQLIEIGGAFRLPDVMAMSNATLREVGCTNRTHLRDYENAINEETGALIHVHTSNFRVRGFAGTPGIRELAPLGHKHDIPVIDDLGSGALVRLSDYGLSDEPLIADSLRAGADCCCFSGDKLICGTQAGIICGRTETIRAIRKNPYARMFRVDKLTLAGLETALLHFINDTYRTALPLYQMLGRPIEELREQASRVADAAKDAPDFEVTTGDDVAYIGSGSIPDQGLPSIVVRVRPTGGAKVACLARALRMGIPSVFCRIADDALLFDMRTIRSHEVDACIERLHAVMTPDTA